MAIVSARRPAVTMALAFVGVALLSLPAQKFRVDVMADHCDAWPPLAVGALYSLAYLGALAALTWAWLRMDAHALTLRRVLLLGLVLHLVALALSPPFLSLDPVHYGAFGRVMAKFGRKPDVPVLQILGPDDPFVRLLPARWHNFPGSPYSRAFNQLTRVVALLGGDSPIANLRIYQLIAAIAMTLAAWLTGLAAGKDRAARAAALVLFCPLAIVESTVCAHNDCLLALTVAAFALLVTLGRELSALIPLIVGTLIKGSGLLLLGIHGALSILKRLPGRQHLTPRRLVAAGTIFLGALIALAFTAPAISVRAVRFSQTFSDGLIGLPREAPEHCTRQFECIPRALSYWVFHWSAPAWAIGILFRVAGALWLLYASSRAARTGETLRWAGTALFIYFLFFQGYFQSWYLLSLLPLLPFAAPRLIRYMKIFIVTSLVYYAIRLPLNCHVSMAATAIKELSEGIVVVGIPGAMLIGNLLRGENDASA